ncbi:MAG TPA: adenylosuccinate synthase [Pseudomonadales bacterium]|nr:adenylosuccinate synthase [Pseudomonadales bacterium]
MHTATAIVGLQYGDEGKGQVVDCLCADHDVVVRYNGGANAGHNVHIGNESFVLHQVPVGALTPGRLNLLGNGVVVTADALLEEIALLTGAGVDLANFRISDRAHLVMPYHLVEERLRHSLASGMLGEQQTLGTTFKGIGPCYADKASRDTAIRVADLYEPERLGLRLEFIVSMKNATLRALAETLGETFTPFDAKHLADICLDWAKKLKPYVGDTSDMLLKQMGAGARILFEGANAALLDVDQGTYPFVTSSNGSVLGIESGVGLAVSNCIQRVGVAKAYMSRVGTGPFVTELHGDDAEKLRKLGHEYGSTTGRPRRIGWLDLPALRHVVTRNGIDSLVLTGLAILASLPTFRICTHYSSAGTDIRNLPASVEALGRCQPVYEDIVVDEPLGSGTDLPGWAMRLVARVNAEVGPVAGVCVGRRRDQIVWLQ